jgi:predicted membrane metal-binding protein
MRLLLLGTGISGYLAISGTPVGLAIFLCGAIAGMAYRR